MIKHVLRGNKTVLAVRGAIIPLKQQTALYGRIKGIKTDEEHKSIRNVNDIRFSVEYRDASPVGVHTDGNF